MTQNQRAENQKIDNNGHFDPQAEYRNLPAVDTLLNERDVAWLFAEFGKSQVTQAARTILDNARQEIAMGRTIPESLQWSVRLHAELNRLTSPSLQPVINATGVIIHTNLGRAPLSLAARQAVSTMMQGYNNLEYDLPSGKRGSRYDHSRDLLCKLTGAEDALVVNNCASAIYLILLALCQHRDVLISRSQLVEIGGGFRIPDVLRQSGAHLVEVGTTNRTRIEDFSANITEKTAAFMRVHSSNFRLVGFVAMPELDELVTTAQAYNQNPQYEVSESKLIVIDDLGSGTLLDTRQFGLAPEPMVQESIKAGADIVSFSGDKLLGGPQAGIIVGRAVMITKLRRHPMARALRVDKMTLAALDATLRSYQSERALEEIPVWRMISRPFDDITEEAKRWQSKLGEMGIDATIWSGESAVGGGSLPGETLPTSLLALSVEHSAQIADKLRQQSLSIICRIQNDHLLFDPRTVLPEQVESLLEAIGSLYQQSVSNRSLSRHPAMT